VVVSSDGYVATTVSGTLVCNVIGTTKDFVVGGSVVDVVIYVSVCIKVVLSVAVFSDGTVTTSVWGTLVFKVIGISMVLFVVGGSDVDIKV